MTRLDGSARFVAFEGGEACGKSTQAGRLAARIGAVLTHEPGGTAAGASLRTIVLDPATELVDRAEALLFAADRAQHVAEVVRPALEAGRHVVTDRYAGSSLVYQGFGRGLAVEDLRCLSQWATRGLWPDVVVLLEVAPDVATARLAVRRPDRLEAAGEAFHRRVGEGFRALAAAEPERWVVVDGSAPVDEVEQVVWATVTERCPDLVVTKPS